MWCQDEQRLGLKPNIRRVWTPVGEQPIASVKTQYQWLWLYVFVHPDSWETYFWILPRVYTELLGVVLADLALLIWPQIKISGYCWSKTKLDGIPVTSWCVAVGIDRFLLSSHSPELQPAERLWSLTNEAWATHSLLNLEELENLLIYRCHKIMQQYRLVQELTCFHLWAKTTGT